jgi:hypothetical protein
MCVCVFRRENDVACLPACNKYQHPRYHISKSQNTRNPNNEAIKGCMKHIHHALTPHPTAILAQVMAEPSLNYNNNRADTVAR